METLCKIWYRFCNLLKVLLFRGCFSMFFKLYKWCQIVHSTTDTKWMCCTFCWMCSKSKIKTLEQPHLTWVLVSPKTTLITFSTAFRTIICFYLQLWAGIWLFGWLRLTNIHLTHTSFYQKWFNPLLRNVIKWSDTL